MSTTVGTLEKKVEMVFENLTPEEKAKYVHDETWNIANRHSEGFDEEAHQRGIERFFHRHVATLSAAGYIEFLITQDKLNLHKWAGMYFTSTLTAYDREDCLLQLLILHVPLDLIIPQRTAKKGKEQITNPAREEMLEQFRKRRAAILKDAKVIWNDDFWEREGLTRPDLSPDFIEAITGETKEPENAEQAGR